MRLYRTFSLATAGVTATLTVVLMFFPEVISWLFALDSDEATLVVMRRAAILMLGIAVMTFVGRDAEDSAARRAMVAGLTATLLGMAALGTIELVRGTVGPGILAAAAVELTLGLGYAWVWRHPDQTPEV